MYDWHFSMSTLEKGRVSFKVRAKDKKTAIDKGFARIRKMGLSTTAHWDCKLAIPY